MKRMTAAITAAILTLTACTNPSPVEPEPVIPQLRGIYVWTMETSTFTPCGLPGIVLWAEGPAMGVIIDYFRRNGGWDPIRDHFHTAYVELDADVLPRREPGGWPGGYGHLGQYAHAINVTHVHQVRPADTAPPRCR